MNANMTLNSYLLQSIRNNWEQLALTDFNGVSYQYKDIARKITKLHIIFRNSDIKPGDRIAICGRNSAHWAVSFFATVCYGAVVVPILNEFKPDNIHHIVNHSEARLLFCNNSIWENLDPTAMPALEGALMISNFSLLMSRNEALTDARAKLNEYFGREFPERFTKDDFNVYASEVDDLLMINYTSGSTGFSKGVMLTQRNIWSNLQFCLDNISWLEPGDGVVSMLPMAHMYGLVVEIIFPFCRGCHINFLTPMPSPKVIMDAFATVHPKMIVAVPLIIEKIIKTRVFPLLDKPLMKLMLHVPLVDEHLLAKVKQKLTETFGGELREMIIGGAALNKEVETFLRRINFPFTVGYGMTECAPLISYAPWEEMRPQSCGRVVSRMEARVDSPDPENVPGVISVRGDNVMSGYYKNDEETKRVMSPDGWMSTGDIGVIDSDNFIYLRGRDKNMILGPSGQNIYPEEIEQKLNNCAYVAESVVIDDGGCITALIYPDYQLLESQGIGDHAAIQQLMEENVATLNGELPGYSQIKRVKLMSEEFEKTPKRSIKRYLYQHK